MPSLAARRRALTAALASGFLVAAGLAVAPLASAAVPTTYPNVVQARSPIAYYRLGEASGTTMGDSSGHGNDGTYSAGVSLGNPAAIVNEADTSAAFGGSDDGQAVGVNAPTSAYTWEAWILRASNADGSIAGQEGAGQLSIQSDQLVLHQTDTDVVGGSVSTGVWHHVAATWDGTTTTLYLDGGVVATSNAAVTPPSGTGTVHVASGDQAPDFVGQLDEVAYYSTALSAGSIAGDADLGVDTVAPTVTINVPVDNGEYLLHAVPPFDFPCSDPGPHASGIRSCTSSGGGTYLGPHAFTATATDRAGNTASKTVFYKVLPIKYADEIARSHPLAYFRMNDPVGAVTMVDSSGHGNDGEYKNGAAPGGHKPAAIACELRPNPPRVCEMDNDPQDWSTHVGDGGYGFVNNMAAPQTAYTLEAWIKPDGNDDGSIVGQGGAGQLYIRGGHLALRQTQDDVLGGGPVLAPGQWWHVAATWDGTNTRLFVNGNLIASSGTARKAPSGTATMYVGLGEQAPPFRGDLDEVAYYPTALSQGVLREHYDIGTVIDWPSIVPMPPDTNTAKPSARISSPPDGALYAPTKTPTLQFTCTDPDGPGDLTGCTATVDGGAVANGTTLPDAPITHTVTVTATDTGGNTDVRTVHYTVMPFADIYRADHPLAYYRLGDSGTVMADASGHGRDGTYKNLQQSGPVGISGDGDLARRFWGDSGYGYADNITAGPWQSTIEAWVNVDDMRDQSIAGLAGTDELFVSGGKFVYRHLDRFVTADVGPTPGTFRQVVGVWDGDTVKIYVDGVLHGTGAAPTGRSSGGGTFYVGFGTQAPWFAGSLDEVVYYVSALSADRVLQHFLADPPAATSAPAACRVPLVRGLRLSAARTALQSAGCRLGTVTGLRAPVRKRGRVLAQSIAAGQVVPAGRSIRVTVGR